MNANRIITMLLRHFMRRATRWGVDRGMKQVTRSAGQPDAGQPGPKSSPAQRQSQALGREAGKRARQLSRITRRLGR